MQELDFFYTTVNSYSSPAVEHDFLLRCIPQDLPEQRIRNFELRVDPSPVGGNYGTDSFGNRTYTGRITWPHDRFSYTVQGRAVRDDSLIEGSEPLPCFSYPSELTRPSASLVSFLDTIDKDDDALVQAQLIREAVYARMEYVSGVTSVKTTASEALEGAKGVCQDYTHIFLALCRLRKIPARYVSGLPEGEGASHAWAEVWYKGRWIGIDPTRNMMVNESYLRFCTGRDFRDCPIEQGIFRGSGGQEQSVFTKVTLVEG